ncbi:MAG: hypothetical protein KBC98_01865 [Candidatus Pacebacteria bacterium]|nr:hypothetical protein [Candidatus Paceibacterota bacterium]
MKELKKITWYSKLLTLLALVAFVYAGFLAGFAAGSMAADGESDGAFLIQ